MNPPLSISCLQPVTNWVSENWYFSLQTASADAFGTQKSFKWEYKCKYLTIISILYFGKAGLIPKKLFRCSLPKAIIISISEFLSGNCWFCSYFWNQSSDLITKIWFLKLAMAMTMGIDGTLRVLVFRAFPDWINLNLKILVEFFPKLFLRSSYT